jgi:hypothetical protein
MTLEIRLLRFSTGQPHPLAEQPIIFITTKSQLLGPCSIHIEIVGDFLALLIAFPWVRSKQEDMFFLVRWKKGEAHCVSGITAHSGLIAQIVHFTASFGLPSGEPARNSVFFRKTPSSSRT